MPQKIKVAIIGPTGYTGIELVRILSNHPYVEIACLISRSDAGKCISEVYPHLKGVCDLPLTDTPLKTVAEKSDVVFLAVPHTESLTIVSQIMGLTKIIDLSGDFRLQNTALYEKYYNHKHSFPKAVRKFIYGFPEINKEKIAVSANVANPGCFALLSQFALLPFKDLIRSANILAVTGSSGSGKTPVPGAHHPVRHHNVKSYKINIHQHIPEILQTTGISETQLNFVPTSGPFTRGIHLTAFLDLKKDFSQAELENLIKKTYKNQPFVRIKNEVELAAVVGSNFCDLAVYKIEGGALVQGVFDNLIKGASGNAIQNFNIMFGFDETESLKALTPLYV
ncbi:N-acetyl-gamma-glutamyl-phosphate reductase [Candidatus Peregrinibacteria bacterium]|nr:N-acetyl-gamma-glutamyl-phosphate reductase [Candidatus Peregrinibacteria bacterium]